MYAPVGEIVGGATMVRAELNAAISDEDALGIWHYAEDADPEEALEGLTELNVSTTPHTRHYVFEGVDGVLYVLTVKVTAE